MLNNEALRQIQVQADRLYLSREINQLLVLLHDQAWSHKHEELLSYSYAHHALMHDTDGKHLRSALALIERRREVPGHSPDDVWIARLLAATGRIEKAIARLLSTPFYGRTNYVSYAAQAVWLACEHGRPELAPTLDDADLAGQVAQLRLAALNDDVESGQWHMHRILADIDTEPLEGGRTAGNVPCPALDVYLGDWLEEAFDSWGNKISWLACSNRKGLSDMSNRLERPINCQPGLLEDKLIKALESGDFATGCKLYQQMANEALAKRCSIPKRWQRARMAPPIDLDAAIHASEELLLEREIDARVILPWYHNVLATLIEGLPPRRSAGLHGAVLARTQCAAARMSCARSYAAGGEFVKAMRMIQPMRYYADWSEEALALEQKWHRNLVSSQVRIETGG